MSAVDYCCARCGLDTKRAGEFYMVVPEVWDAVTGSNQQVMLCVGCVEHRLGRQLAPTDFTDAPVNDHPRRSRYPHGFWNRKSSRLLARLGYT